MISSAEKLVDALQKVQMAVTPQEKDAAAKELVRTELAHYDKLGIERSPQGPLQRIVLPLAVIAVVVATSVLVVIFSAAAANTASDVAQIQQQSVIDNRESCERQNQARAAAVKEKRAELQEKRAQLGLWLIVAQNTDAATAAKTPASVTAAFEEFLHRLRQGIHSKHEAIEGLIEPYAPVAIRPGSPRVDCSLAFPSR